MLLRLLTLAVMIVAGCSDDAPSDANVDARGDAPADSRADVPSDTPADRADVPDDAIPDVARDAGVADWVRLPGLPADCNVELAQNPSALLSVSWTECGTGCSQLLLPNGAEVLSTTNNHDGTGYFALNRREDRVVILATTGATVAGWRSLSSDVCQFAFVGGGGGGRPTRSCSLRPTT